MNRFDLSNKSIKIHQKNYQKPRIIKALEAYDRHHNIFVKCDFVKLLYPNLN